jgi:glycosyltransferase involved in cell wall biosynthesis
MDKYDLSLILACYNEAEIFENSVQRILNTLDKTDLTYEVIFVEDKSQDNTVELIKKAINKYPRHNLLAFFHQTNLGRGQTVKDGFLKAKGKIVGYIDIDLEIGEWYLPRFLSEIDKNIDATSAFRIYDFSFWALPRYFASKGYVWLRKLLIGLPYQDTEAGYKFFKRSKLLPLLKQSKYKDWFFDTEIMALCFKHKLKVKEIPVAFVRNKQKTSTVKLISDSINYLINLIKFSIRFNLK